MVLILRSIPTECQALTNRQELSVLVLVIRKEGPIPDRLVEVEGSSDLEDHLLVELLIASLSTLGADTGFHFSWIARSQTADAEADDGDEKQGRDKEQDAPDYVLEHRWLLESSRFRTPGTGGRSVFERDLGSRGAIKQAKTAQIRTN